MVWVANDKSPVPSYSLHSISRSHNQSEITSEEWLQLAIVWAEAMLKQQPPQEPEALD
jgi:hypothetical protein